MEAVIESSSVVVVADSQVERLEGWTDLVVRALQAGKPVLLNQCGQADREILEYLIGTKDAPAVHPNGDRSWGVFVPVEGSLAIKLIVKEQGGDDLGYVSPVLAAAIAAEERQTTMNAIGLLRERSATLIRERIESNRKRLAA